ncbi:MAG: acyltransferase family protein [Lentisphaeria bacterium]|nr:acyltransferase family protein [Lentisphaeria bacterium]
MKIKHWTEIDGLYALGILLVLMGHSHSSDWSRFQNTPLVSLIKFIYTFHMAMFIFVAGFLFQNSDSLKNIGYRKWLLDKALRLLTPYAFWSLIALVPKYFAEHHGFTGLNVHYLMKVVFHPRLGIWGHFWFLPVLFFLYLVFGGIHAVVKNQQWKLLIICELLFSGILYFLPVKNTFLGLADITENAIFFAVGMATYLLFSMFGKPVRWRGGALWILICLSGVSVAFLLRDSAHAHRVVGLPVALLMIAVCWLLVMQMPYSSIIQYLSGHNFTIYIFSWLFQSIVMMFCDKLHFAWYLTFMVMFTAGLLGSMVVIFIYEHLPFLHCRPVRLLLGVR